MVVEIVLGLKDLSKSELLVESDKIRESMKESGKFTSPEFETKIKDVETETNNLRTEMNAAYSITKSDKVNKAKNRLLAKLKILGSAVESLANDTTTLEEDRELIAHSAGMAFKTHTPRLPQTFTVKNVKKPGAVVLTAKGQVNAHDWKYRKVTEGNNAPWEDIESSTLATITVENLDVDVKLEFMHRSIVPGEKPIWEGPIAIMVN